MKRKVLVSIVAIMFASTVNAESNENSTSIKSAKSAIVGTWRSKCEVDKEDATSSYKEISFFDDNKYLMYRKTYDNSKCNGVLDSIDLLHKMYGYKLEEDSNSKLNKLDINTPNGTFYTSINLSSTKMQLASSEDDSTKDGSSDVKRQIVFKDDENIFNKKDSLDLKVAPNTPKTKEEAKKSVIGTWSGECKVNGNHEKSSSAKLLFEENGNLTFTEKRFNSKDCSGTATKTKEYKGNYKIGDRGYIHDGENVLLGFEYDMIKKHEINYTMLYFISDKKLTIATAYSNLQREGYGKSGNNRYNYYDKNGYVWSRE